MSELASGRMGERAGGQARRRLARPGGLKTVRAKRETKATKSAPIVNPPVSQRACEQSFLREFLSRKTENAVRILAHILCRP